MSEAQSELSGEGLQTQVGASLQMHTLRSDCARDALEVDRERMASLTPLDRGELPIEEDMALERRLASVLSGTLGALLLLGALSAVGCGESAESSADDGDQGDEGTRTEEQSAPSTDEPKQRPPGKVESDAGQDKPARPSPSDAGKASPGPSAQLDAGKPAALEASTEPTTDAGKPTPAPNPQAGSFPRADEVTVAANGPYTVKTYSEGLRDPAYASSMMYYPEGREPPYAAIAFSPGFTATKESYTYLGQLLASHGFAVLLTTPTSTSDQPPARGKDLEAAVARIASENAREGSPLKGKLAADRVCITGHSMGGGGTLHGASALGDKIRCAVPLQPWQPGASFAQVKAPVLFIGAQNDTIAGVSSNASTHYRSIPGTKIYAEVKGADHYYSTNQNRDHVAEAHVMVAFYKLYLEDDERYKPYLYGDKKLASAFSKYEAVEK